LGHALYRGPKFLFPIWNSWVLKDAEFYVDFKNKNYINICDKMHLKKVIQENRISLLHRGPPV
jgi:murein L,D-transpeptidase YafK